MLKILNQRFNELVAEADSIVSSGILKYSDGGQQYREIDQEKYISWTVKAKNLIIKTCEKESMQYEDFVKAGTLGFVDEYIDALKRQKAVFLAVKNDYEGGYLSSMRSLVQSEISESELDQARELLQAGYVTAAAVVSGVVLENTLRSLCDKHKIPHGKMDKMNADLVKAGEYNSLKQKQITFLAGVRNSAAHGKTNDFSRENVETMISDIERIATEALN